MAHSVDVEKQQGADLDASSSNERGSIDGTATHNENAELKRDMKPRHVMMFSIACAIGTGLVIGSGTGLARGGPGSMLIAYIMIGAAVFFVMTGLGEMAAFVPMNKGFGGYASRMVDPAFGYVVAFDSFFCEKSMGRMKGGMSDVLMRCSSVTRLVGITFSSISWPPRPT